ncbi:MAG TPA: hypothetical protein VML91_05655 [Burkholderiales bacterium]|nr:hypothetical protein [Burkholderiales bacterium]
MTSFRTLSDIELVSVVEYQRGDDPVVQELLERWCGADDPIERDLYRLVELLEDAAGAESTSWMLGAGELLSYAEDLIGRMRGGKR